MAKKFRVCLLTDDPFFLGGGPEHIKNLKELLQTKYQCSVEVITPRSMDPKFAFSDFAQRLKYLVWLCKYLLTSDFDIYHSHAFSTSFVLPIVKLKGKKIGVTIHGAGVGLVGPNFINKLQVPRIMMNLVLTRWPFDFRLSASTLPGFVTVGNGVNWEEFKNLKHKTAKVFTVLCISRRDPIKGIAILEAAISNIPGCRLKLVSGRPRTVTDFSGADCYALPSLSEGLPIVLLEAMAAKLPVVASSVGDVPLLVKNGVTGLLVTPGDVNDLTDKLAKMKSSKDRKKMGENGYHLVKEKYSWTKVAEITYRAYINSLD